MSRSKKRRLLREGKRLKFRTEYDRLVYQLRKESKRSYLGLGPSRTGVAANDQIRMWGWLNIPF